MRNEKIAGRQLWFILFLLRTTIILAYLPVLTSANALQDAWISALITLLGSEVFVLFISLLATRFPNRTVIEYSQVILGNWPGRLIGLVFLWLFLQLSVVDIRIYSELVVTGFLPNTPPIVIIIAVVFLAAICVREGVEIIGRMADVFFSLFFLMIVGVVIISLNEFDFKNIQPILYRGWQPVFKGALTPVALIIQVWVLGILVPDTLNPRKTVKIALTSIGISLLILVVITFVTIGVLSPQEGARATFPLLTLIRSVSLSRFLERVEVLVILAWGLGLFISVCTYLYCGAKAMAQWLKLKEYRPLVFPMSVFWVVLSLHGFENIFSLYEYLKPENFFPYGAVLLTVPLAILWIGYFLRKYFGGLKGEEN